MHSWGPHGAFPARVCKAEGNGLGRSTSLALLGSCSQTLGQVLCRKGCDIPHFPPRASFPGTQPCPDSQQPRLPAAQGLPIPHLLPLPASSRGLQPASQIPPAPSFPKAGFHIFLAEQQWVCLVCLFLPRRGWLLTMDRSPSSPCAAQEEEMKAQQQIHQKTLP